jgi:molecular chaperone DnaK
MPQIDVTFDIDANGIVNVSAKDKATGKEQKIRIQASGGLSDEDIEKMVQEAETHAEDDKTRRESIEAKNNANALIHSTEKNLEEHGDKIPETDRTEIESAVQALKDVLESEDTDEIKSKSEALMQVAMKLGEAMYKDSQGDPVPGMDDVSDDSNTEKSSKNGSEDETVVDADFEEVEPEKKDK